MALAARADWRDYLAHAGPGRHTVTGRLKVLSALYSPQLRNRRDVYVYLPPSYEARPAARFPVIYMHDGQNLFDRATSFVGREWRVDETIEALSREGLEAIVVGISNMGVGRKAEYNPFPQLWNARAERYLAFVVETVKRIVDRDFRTSPDRAETGMIGSSLGATLSLYAYFRHWQVFGFVGAMSPSTSLVGTALAAYVRRAPFAPGKLYLDDGTAEPGCNAGQLYTLLRDKGYRPGRDVLYVSEEGGRHDEDAWARRLPDALRFLLR